MAVMMMATTEHRETRNREYLTDRLLIQLVKANTKRKENQSGLVLLITPTLFGVKMTLAAAQTGEGPEKKNMVSFYLTSMISSLIGMTWITLTSISGLRLQQMKANAIQQ